MSDEKQIAKTIWEGMDVDIIAWNVESLHIMLMGNLMGSIALQEVIVGEDFTKYYFYGENFQVEFMKREILTIHVQSSLNSELYRLDTNNLKESLEKYDNFGVNLVEK